MCGIYNQNTDSSQMVFFLPLTFKLTISIYFFAQLEKRLGPHYKLKYTTYQIRNDVFSKINLNLNLKAN